MEMWMRAHSVSCPPLFSDEVAQFMFALYRRCLPHVISVTSNSLRSLCPFDTLHCTHMLGAHVQYSRGYLSVWECWTFFFFKAALDSSTVDEQATGKYLCCTAQLVSLPPHYRCTDVCPAMRGSELSD